MIVDRPKAIQYVDSVRMYGRCELPIVFTNGCFDLIVPQHVKLLQVCSSYGFTVVSLNSDASVRRLKGPGRPILCQDDRAEIVDRIRGVSLVFVNDDDSPVDAIEQIRPAYLVKGTDWLEQRILGSEEVNSWGGKVVRVRSEGIHSSDIVTEILSRGESFKTQ
jgi:D-beta-D-heptose 7-phosphate kinase/D-beta-D-heptose 1-phosphate adenosyltransferase